MILKYFLFLALVSSICFAEKKESIYVPVTHVEIVYELKKFPREECWIEKTYKKPKVISSKEILGGLLGAGAAYFLTKDKHTDTQAAAVAVGALVGSEILDEDHEVKKEEVIGGVLGGAIGSQFGKNKGKVLASGAGAIVGQLVGEHLDKDNKKVYLTRYCKRFDVQKEVISHYLVTYLFEGKTYKIKKNYYPLDYRLLLD